MIYKLQRPLYSTGDGTPPVLAYTKGRNNEISIPMTPELDGLFGAKVKVYAEAHVVGGKLVVVKVVPDQRW